MQTPTQIRVRETVDVAADDLFAVLANPRRHLEIDARTGRRSRPDDWSPVTDRAVPSCVCSPRVCAGHLSQSVFHLAAAAAA